MATVNVTRTYLGLNEVTEIPYKSATSADTIVFDFNGAGDEKLVILAEGEITLTVKKGDMIQGVTDVEGEITTAGAIRIDSGLFKNATGTNKGKVTATATSAVSVALIQLP